jgi:hypothetical protein
MSEHILGGSQANSAWDARIRHQIQDDRASRAGSLLAFAPPLEGPRPGVPDRGFADWRHLRSRYAPKGRAPP